MKIDVKDREVKSGNIYENSLLAATTGQTLRPGGFQLTDWAVDYCGFQAGDKVLDVGCGYGATVDRLRTLYGLEAYGIEPSEKLLTLGQQAYPGLPVSKGRGEDIPFADDFLEGVFVECSLSLMAELDKALGEIKRVLKGQGKLIIHDVYARNPQGAPDLQKLNIGSCLRQAFVKEELTSLLGSTGFLISHWQDHSNLLNQLTMALIMTHGSLSAFWQKSGACSADPTLVQAALKKAKVGYFQLIVQKQV